MVLYHRGACKIRFSDILKVNVIRDPYLNKITRADPFIIENILFPRHCDIQIIKAKNITDAFISVMFIFKNSDTFETVQYSLFNSPFIIRRCGYHFRSTDLADKPYS